VLAFAAIDTTPGIAEARSAFLSSPVAVAFSATSNRGGASAFPAANLHNSDAGHADGSPLAGESDQGEAATPLEQAETASTPAPHQAGLLANALAVDAGKLQAGIRSFLDQLDQLGAALTAGPSAVTLSCWLLAVAAAGSACVIVQRQLSRQASKATEDPLFPWTTEADRTPAEELP
jgi:hypothetical protein